MSQRLHSPFDLKVDLDTCEKARRKPQTFFTILTNAYKKHFGLANGGDELSYCIRHDLNESKKAT